MGQEKISIKEVKELVPLADVYKLNTTSVYLIMVNKPKIFTPGGNSPIKDAEQLAELLKRNNLSCLFIALDDKDEIKILELKQRI